MKDAVIHSTNYWYAINSGSDYKSKITAVGGVAALYPTKPTDLVISNWGDTIKTSFAAAATIDDKMEILMQQKYIHLNLMQPYELWTELRRTGHPKLEIFRWHGTVWSPFPERVHYPSSEQQNNPTNYAKASAANNVTTKIFWVPSDRNATLYWSDYNYK
ncbi:MAG: SusD/RagB family nutrient-binding outer membrane lipoprotein [Chitinophagaceae bacterium]